MLHARKFSSFGFLKSLTVRLHHEALLATENVHYSQFSNLIDE